LGPFVSAGMIVRGNWRDLYLSLLLHVVVVLSCLDHDIQFLFGLDCIDRIAPTQQACSVLTQQGQETGGPAVMCIDSIRCCARIIALDFGESQRERIIAQ
jgi:hypothetical protein